MSGMMTKRYREVVRSIFGIHKAQMRCARTMALFVQSLMELSPHNGEYSRRRD